MRQAKPVVPWILRKHCDCYLYELFADPEVIQAIHRANLDGIARGIWNGRGYYLIEMDPRYDPDDVLEAVRGWLAENAPDDAPGA